MKKSRFTETPIVAILKEADAGGGVKELCRPHGISEATFYNWKARYGGMSAQRLHVDNGPEFLSAAFVAWADSAGLAIQSIPKGEPNQNAYMERFNRPYRAEVLNLSLFRNLAEVREPTHWWRIDYKERRPHDALGGVRQPSASTTMPKVLV